MWRLSFIGLTEHEKIIINYLLDDFIDLSKKDLSGIELKIQNEPFRLYPQICPKRMNAGQREDHIIYLCHAPEYWCQMIYQLAHELGHLLMDCYPEKKNLKWISECLCELFSLIFLTRAIKYFEYIAPKYIESVKDYIRNLLEKGSSYSTSTCSELVAQKMTELCNDPTEDGKDGRPRNEFMAVKLFESLGYDGRGISAVCLFKELSVAKSSEDFFNLWLQKCRSSDETYFVQKLKEVFGL